MTDSKSLLPNVVPIENSGSPFAAGNAARAENISKMTSLKDINKGGSKRKYKYVKKGGDNTMTVNPLSVPYPNSGGLSDANVTMAKVSAYGDANRAGDNAWKAKGGRSKVRRSKVRRSKVSTRRRK